VTAAVAMAAASGLSYGASDFSGAIASKDNDATVVAATVQAISLVVLGAIVLMSTTDATTADIAWGALAGLGGGLGLATFYRALARGPMSTAASLTALVSAAIPVATGLVLGDKPGALTLIGIGIAVPAGVLVAAGGLESRAHGLLSPRDRAVAASERRRTQQLSVVAGIGFSLFFIALSRTSEDAGLLPLVSARGTSVAALGVLIVMTGGSRSITRAAMWPMIAAGLLDCAANVLYLSALRDGTFTWVAALSSLYPVSTVLLARVLLDERLSRWQIVGLFMAASAMVLVAVGA
jgi:drug/metabolite transporter (DMT)-like permease